MTTTEARIYGPGTPALEPRSMAEFFRRALNRNPEPLLALALAVLQRESGCFCAAIEFSLAYPIHQSAGKSPSRECQCTVQPVRMVLRELPVVPAAAVAGRCCWHESCSEGAERKPCLDGGMTDGSFSRRIVVT